MKYHHRLCINKIELYLGIVGYIRNRGDIIISYKCYCRTLNCNVKGINIFFTQIYILIYYLGLNIRFYEILTISLFCTLHGDTSTTIITHSETYFIYSIVCANAQYAHKIPYTQSVAWVINFTFITFVTKISIESGRTATIRQDYYLYRLKHEGKMK